jgi:putative membrane protein insertion efficiency factor
MNQPFKTTVVYLLRAYKQAISPWLRPACRYVPTCSEYAMEAVEIHGALRGSLMAMWRILRLAKGGYDPVIRPKNSQPHELCSH